ncbi:MAG: PHP domain-containing protein [Synergistaceae bacterium]
MDDKKTYDYCHLHNHSYYSILDGLSSPKQMVESAVANGFRALAITDHGTCGGWYNFQKACIAAKIKPILGNEVYVCPDHTAREANDPRYHLILLAKNYKGVQNLMHLSTISETDGKYKKPRIDFELLKKYHEGIICSTACCIGELPVKLWQEDEKGAIDFANRYKDLFGDDFYIEIMMHKYNDSSKDQEIRERKLAKSLYQLAKKLGIKTICTNDAHYANKGDAKYHDIMLAMQTHSHIKDPNRFTFDGNEFYLRPYDEMYALYKSAPEMLSNTMEIADKIEKDAVLKSSKDLLPHFNVPQGIKSEEQYLKVLVKEGMRKKGLIGKKEYRDRIRMEMDLIISCGFVRYFLTLWDIINFANQQGIRVGVGRGCFTPDTLVQCEKGLKPIKDVTLEDKVLSYDDKYHSVSNLLSYDVDEEMVEIEMEDGRKFTCTLDHKIHIKKDGELKFIEAGNLTEDDEIFDMREGFD